MQYDLRPISPQDKAALQRLHLRLSPETRYRRFHGAKGKLTNRELRYLTEVDGERHRAVVAVTEDGELHGVARQVGDEVAVVVEDAVQSDGVGRDLLRRLLSETDAPRLRFEVQADNHRALRFFQGFGARQAGLEGGVVTLVIERGARSSRSRG